MTFRYFLFAKNDSREKSLRNVRLKIIDNNNDI